MTLTAQLQEAGRAPALPMRIPLSGGGSVTVDQWLRVLPGKRLVARAMQDDTPVLLKLFIGAGADRHCARERLGLSALAQQGVATPKLLAEGEVEGSGRYLITEFLSAAQTLQQAWEALPGREPGQAEAMGLLGKALAVIAELHSKGLAQTDLHLGNFLLQSEQLFVIDGDAVEALSPGRPLTAEQAQQNLAIFFAQLKPEWDAFTELLLITYLQHNPLALNPDKLAASIARVRRQRQDDYLGKSLRDCTLFSVQRSWQCFTAVVRSESERMRGLLGDPDSYFGAQPLLKDGGSSTVAKVALGDGSVVIKRYNIKGLMHWLKRFWRPSRAWHSWQAAHRLAFLGVATPAPLAMIERRFGPLRREAWLINEYCAGDHLFSVLGESGEMEPDETTGPALLKVFQQLVAARISHGDCKATNLLWLDGEVLLIDLDAMQQHQSPSQWQQAWARDRARFIRNWPQGSPLANWLEQHLPVVAAKTD
ncbi:Lipopolysaccharide kinase (Kdo/WaaP) family protein [Halopseudomonas sabulinigri]|uniref:Lipopolysaccharide kinase (Kdo/WaaP) family protein n=1 Tax=Halopseudomonas sabulinigri TaxID=472181 RepID=A0A1H1QV51_9GAMM|nr:lipopolysaccharide kinase InaA family protein [Halopseudomonas sabulinigri]SDS26749.1 Lipopolysaccharide kinase (Kdo/WaaP) family protein [Halopseudomonas sabulinigri]